MLLNMFGMDGNHARVNAANAGFEALVLEEECLELACRDHCSRYGRNATVVKRS